MPMPMLASALARLERYAWGLAAFALMSSAALAAPDDAVDPVTRLLLDRGLIEAPGATTSAPVENQLLRKVRERASEMVLTALNYVGVRYRRGGLWALVGLAGAGPRWRRRRLAARLRPRRFPGRSRDDVGRACSSSLRCA